MKEIIVVETEAEIDLLRSNSVMIITFLTQADYERFSDQNLHFTDQIEEITTAIFGEKCAKQHINVGYDWWPDHTRHVECDSQYFSQEFFDAISALLVNEYTAWRIFIDVYDDCMKSNTFVGSLTVWANKILMSRSLFEWTTAHELDFGADAKMRFVTVNEERFKFARTTLLDDIA